MSAEGVPIPSGSENRLLSGTSIFEVKLFFVAMLVPSTTFQHQRGVMLTVLMGIATLLAFRHWRVHSETIFLRFATMVVSAVGIIWGAINDAPGALRVSTNCTFWLAVHLLFIGIAQGLSAIRWLESALLLGISIATAVALAFRPAGLLGLDDIVLPVLAFQDIEFDLYEELVEFRFFDLAT